MKTTIGILVLALCSFLSVEAQRRVVTTTRAMSYDISDNLDLDAVASIFGDSENLEDFERRLNDPDNRISNLDLNEDGYIDYLRVVENSSDRNSLVVVQAVLDQDIYQDVATIEIEKVQNGRLRVQIVGDAYIYGSNYIIEPVFVHTPVIFSFFWSSHYRPYYSPYYWNYYPRWYSYYSPYPTYRYHRHIHNHINYHNTYSRTSERNIHFSDDRYNHVRRSDYASRYPDRTFSKRNEGYSNRYELERKRPVSSNGRQGNRAIQQSGNNREYQYNGQTRTGRNQKSGTISQSGRTSTNVQSGSGRSRTREYNSKEYNTNRNQKSGTINESRRSSTNVHSGSDISKARENKQVTTNPNRSGSSSRREPAQVKSGSRNESSNGGSVSRSRSLPTTSPNRSGNQVDSRRSTPREKSGSISHGRNSNTEVKQAPQNSRKSESSKSEEKSGSGNGRRR